MKKLFFALVAVACGAALAVLAQSGDSGEVAAARKPLEQYIQGHATGKAEVMRLAFHPSARLQFMRNGQYTTRTLEEFLAGFSGAPAKDEAQRKRRIVSVDIFGESAMGKIELDYPDALIMDYMSLLKVDGEWKIVNKVFHVRPKTK